MTIATLYDSSVTVVGKKRMDRERKSSYSLIILGQHLEYHAFSFIGSIVRDNN